MRLPFHRQRRCRDCHFLVRHEVRIGDDGQVRGLTDVLWNDEDTANLRDAVSDLLALPSFRLVPEGYAGQRFGADCARGVFAGVEGDPDKETVFGHPIFVAGDEDEARKALHRTVERNRTRRECFYTPRVDGMAIKPQSTSRTDATPAAGTSRETSRPTLR